MAPVFKKSAERYQLFPKGLYCFGKIAGTLDSYTTEDGWGWFTPVDPTHVPRVIDEDQDEDDEEENQREIMVRVCQLVPVTSE